MKDIRRSKRKLSEDIKINKYSIENDSYDIHTFQSIVKNNKTIRNTASEGEKFYPPFAELHQDLFDALYKYDPKFFEESSIARSHILNMEVMKQIVESPKYKELRNLTRLDEINATVGTEVMGEEVKQLLEELKEQYEEMMKAIQDAQDAMDQASNDAEDGEESEEDENAPPGKGSNKMTYEEAKKLLEEAMQKPRELIDKEVQRGITKMLDEAVKQTMETSDMIQNWGLDYDETYIKSGYQDKLALLERLRSSRKLKEIAELAGRYKRLAMTTQREKVKRGIDEVYDIRPGGDLSRALPSELMKLRNPKTSLLLKKDMLENNLLQYEYSGKEKKNKGPIIVCLDSSGSMGGQAEVWSKAVAMGVLEIARAQKRSMFVLHFDSRPAASIHTNSFPKDKPYSIEEILDMAEYFTGGGTLFEPPLDLSRKKIDEDGEFTKADIIFVTDGESAVRPAWLKNFLAWKKQKNVSIYSVLIDASFNSDECLKEFSDSINKLSSLRKNVADELATTIFSVL